ncbi:vesicle-associated membrane protein/synaptobrevin-binding protein isoform X1 [Patella vulgata]|uniref:vesicle-associated membrane protein/synaptobrevin-binding protein isoform X1 n=1 Tax=Patella vulgata TaxID=6465 RepID=UPI00218089C3|nr:vesicle-associated membrane protein/synaptobrevin-binding protein isoform X1 [Patella vulgata]
MAKNEQVLQLEPSTELRFRGPFTDVISADLKLTNPSDKRVCFKVKTTAPKRYCVRPNSGVLEPKAHITVAVMLQPFEYDATEKSNKHKFMVQTLFAPDGPINQEQLWKEVLPENLMDSKLKCVFEMPESDHIEAKVTKPVETTKQSSGGDNEVKKVMEDYKKLQSELSQLKTENNQLREEGVRLRKVAVSETVHSTPISTTPTKSAQATGLVLPPMVYLIAALILGLLIGKLVL